MGDPFPIYKETLSPMKVTIYTAKLTFASSSISEISKLHVQLYDPLVLLQTASALQECFPVEHSSKSKYASHKSRL